MTQDWVRYLLLAIDLLKNGLIFTFLVFFALLNGGLLIDVSNLLLIFERSNDVFFMEWFSPSIRDPVFHFIFHGLFIWRPCKCLSQGLFVQLVEFVIKLSDHLLNAGSLLFLVQFVVNGGFNVFICVKTLLLLRPEWLLL